MSLTDVRKDTDQLTMTVTAEYDVSAERAWQLVGDPRQLERWWGPPTYPASVYAHDLRAGGLVRYSMTGPEGDTHHGLWEVVEAQPPRVLVVEDGFAHADGTLNTEMPRTRMRWELGDRPGGGVVLTITSQFASLEAMQKLLEMQMEEGMRQAVGQVDAILAEQPVR